MYTSFTHVGTVLPSNPILPKVLLSIKTCITLAMGLVLTSSIPRMSVGVLGAIRDFIVEAETIRLKHKVRLGSMHWSPS